MGHGGASVAPTPGVERVATAGDDGAPAAAAEHARGLTPYPEGVTKRRLRFVHGSYSPYRPQIRKIAVVDTTDG